ncbi:subunit B of p-aminobenzoyl-glutamate hydrolase [Clostridium sporogenes]|uniref:M20 family peptidase n=1 Tax=Clostridium botulinum TaxID=1491 RepID=UPI0007179F3D|nr:M20 family peptidase [Clostridium botulinum]KRU24815.1 subunit B of p-aminobenzoyl-glutamate hydrolase [Clostridium sporogenes]KRU31711.1 subunit B of p-aminobenzoyl-glutamate hydrolase [Clostridium sporogenes]KRU33976.1 subunit B of p-aminobenzoyl-glutamate hydrolase [Clostridium sporogenes]KRU40993.1 subunit B of p-aminobenzoyl-glutamate hydrolase [Clostridium sporogenes]MBZ1328414.1 M20 family peptidase [Clostridium botulinum]
MKQKIVSYLKSIESDLFNISKYLYDNPETSFNEYKSCKYLIDILKKNNFNVQENYYNIPTSFYAEFGKGYPKICFFCEYDAPSEIGHVSGHNLVSSISLGAALSLSKVIDNFSGTIIVMGTPGESLSGSKVTLAKQGAFKDIDVGLMVHPDEVTCQSGSSMAILPLKIKFRGKETLSYENTNVFSSLNGLLYTFNSINLLKQSINKNFHIDKLVINSGKDPYISSNTTEAKFYIRSKSISTAIYVEKRIRKIVDNVNSLLNLDSEICFFELPYRELITNKRLSRLFCHNLKEAGIIDICNEKNTVSGLSLGTVSHYIPCIHPYISILDKNSSVNYFTKEFADETLTKHAQQNALKASQALSLTALDLIQNDILLKEVKKEFFNKIE